MIEIFVLGLLGLVGYLVYKKLSHKEPEAVVYESPLSSSPAVTYTPMSSYSPKKPSLPTATAPYIPPSYSVDRKHTMPADTGSKYEPPNYRKPKREEPVKNNEDDSVNAIGTAAAAIGTAAVVSSLFDNSSSSSSSSDSSSSYDSGSSSGGGDYSGGDSGGGGASSDF